MFVVLFIMLQPTQELEPPANTARFREAFAAHADRPALRYPERDYSYSELNAQIDALAAMLMARGLVAGDVIMIGSAKQPLSYALMLAALRLGVAYVNIDVESPQARNARILDVSAPKILFFDDPRYAAAMEALAASGGVAAVALREEDLAQPDEAARQAQQDAMRRVDGATIAYVMFTSGSTGEPKGVAVTHQNVLHFIAWARRCFSVGPQDVFAQLSPLYFDNSVFDFYAGLFSGACLCPIPRELLAAPQEMTRRIGEAGCTIWFSVPSLLIFVMTMKVMTPAQTPGLRLIIFGGEGYPKPELAKLYERFRDQATLVNVYGPTECTCICSAYPLSQSDFTEPDGLPPLGELNQNFDHIIAGEDGREAEQGELCLIGPNVAAGYFNDPARTQAAFETLQTPNRFMKRMYRTGDIVRRDAGLLHFLGRKDNQIKHMGYRIELEEIENALARLPGVSQAAAIYQRTDGAAYGKIIGFVAGADTVDEKRLLADLGALLPSYMTPSRLMIRASLPKNANGKVDRRALLSTV